MKKILITSNFSTTFINTDIEILKNFSETKIILDSSIFSLAKKIFYIFFNDLSFIWFASIHSAIQIFFSKLLNKKTILILGGIELAKIKEVNYGTLNSFWKSFFIKYSIKNATKVLAVDKSLKTKALQFCNYDGENLFVVPTGYDEKFWFRKTKKNNLVLMVANVPDFMRFKIKGVEKFIKVAQILPKIKFKLIGVNYLQNNFLPKNLEIINFQSQNFLRDEYSRAKIYCQLSMSEGLPNTLCEAMLCEVFPIVTDVGGMAKAVGKTGIVLVDSTPENIAKHILKNIKNVNGIKARERIIKNFSLSKRITTLNNLILNA